MKPINLKCWALVTRRGKVLTWDGSETPKLALTLERAKEHLEKLGKSYRIVPCEAIIRPLKAKAKS